MSATVDVSLIIGDAKSRFCLNDEVTLILTSGRKVSGRIIELSSSSVILEGEDDVGGWMEIIVVSEIEDCIT